jgi:hypothetical protein
VRVLGLVLEEEEYFITPHRVRQLSAAKAESSGS